MKFSIDQLAKSVLQKDSFAQCSNNELQQLVDQYPYFGAAQLLFAKKLLSENVEQGAAQLERTSLLFHDPLWLQHLISDTGNAEIIPASPLFEEGKKVTIAENIIYLPADIPEEKPEMFIEKTEYPEEPMEDDSGIEVKLPAFNIKPVDPDNAKLIFEPYHTVDYFASLGIKFKEEITPQDKFGKQLKSFTEWLKTLKKLPESAISQNLEPDTEQKVEKLADLSIRDRDIITETMADVWKKQGNIAKAIEIYNKLSLLDASKRPYFAAKIEELKKIN